MAELINRQNLLDLYANPEFMSFDMLSVPIPIVRQNILDMPTVDAVPVVRCGKCRHADTIDHTLYCFHWERNTDEDGFCHEGC